jgi:hypothetical protein
LDATYLKVREAGRIVSVAVTIATGINGDGRREVLGMAIPASSRNGRRSTILALPNLVCGLNGRRRRTFQWREYASYRSATFESCRFGKDA